MVCGAECHARCERVSAAMKWWLALAATGLVTAAVLVIGGRWARVDELPAAAPFEVTDILSAPGDGFLRVTGPRPLEFPADHGPHPGYRTEWWYYTGHLRSETGRRFGFQLTFFRFALTPAPVPRSSAWAADNVYMAHFALSDIDGDEFHSFERISRQALELAGARATPFQVWVEDWSVRSEGPAFLPLRLSVSDGEVAVLLRLTPGKPLVLQGDAGYSAKSDEAGNASHYYSFTRLPVSGEVRAGGETHVVSGNAWMDREWSTSALAPGQLGWDWFALQLDDGRDIMFYQLRAADGGVDRNSAGLVVAADGSSDKLDAHEVTVTPQAYWSSPVDGARYPVSWHVSIPRLDLSVQLNAYLPQQEHRLSVRYWEGAASVRGTADSMAISGDAYVEIAGTR